MKNLIEICMENIRKREKREEKIKSEGKPNNKIINDNNQQITKGANNNNDDISNPYQMIDNKNDNTDDER